MEKSIELLQKEIIDLKKKVSNLEQFASIFNNQSFLGAIITEIIFDSNNQPIDFKIEWVNTAFEELTQTNSTDLVGKLVSQIFGNIEDYWFEATRKAITERKTVRYSNINYEKAKWFELEFHFINQNLIATVFHDITKRNTYKAELNEIQHLHKILNNNTLGVIWIADFESRNFTYLSHGISQILGYEPHELIGEKYHKILSYSSRLFFETITAKNFKHFLQNPTNPKIYTHTANVIHKNGTNVLVEFTGNYRINEITGKVEIAGTIKDITESYRAIQQLKASEEKYKLLADSITDVVWLLKLDDLCFTYVSPSVTRLTGFSEAEFLQKKLHEVLAPDSYQLVISKMKEFISPTELDINDPLVQTQVVNNICKDNSLITTEVITRIVFDDNKKPLILGVARDITQRIRTEKALKESERKYKSFLKNFPGIAYYADEKYSPILIDGKIEEIFDRDKDEFLNKNVNWQDIICSEDWDYISETSKIAINTPNFWTYREYRITRKNGTLNWVGEYIQNISDEDGKFQYIQGSIYDINRRKTAEIELKQAADIFTNILSGIYVYQLENIEDDRTLRLVMANPASETLAGAKVSEIIGKTLDENFPLLREQGIPQAFANVIRTNKPAFFENLHYKDEKIDGVYSIKAFPLPGNRIGIAFENFIEKVKAIKEVDRQRDFNAKITSTSPVGIITLDKNGKITFANNRAETILGLDKNIIINKYFNKENWEITDLEGNDFPEENTPFEIVKRTQKEVYNIRHGIQRPDGKRMLLAINANPLFDENKEFDGAIAILMDITEIHLAQKVIQENELKLKIQNEEYITINEELTESNKKIQFMLDDLQKAKEFVEDSEKRLKIQNEEYISINEELSESNQRIQKINLELIHAKERVEDSEKQLKIQNEEYLSINEELSESNQRIQKMLNELKIAKDRAEESDKLKTAFLCNMSHEIRTPMNGIIGFAELLRDENLEPETKENYIEIINKSSQKLMNVINDILDISKIETNQIDVTITKFDLHELLEELYEIYQSQTQKKNIDFILVKDSKTDVLNILTDRLKLYQTLNNLLNNAVKYTSTGFIKYGYKLDGDFIDFFVEDSGVGIATENHKIIFDRFRQASADPTKLYQGTGLGLAISKAFIEKLGGKIRLRSELDMGSKFSFSIPGNTDEHKSLQLLKTGVKKFGRNNESKVLIVEDEEINYLYLKEIMIKQKISVIRANDGLEAIETFKNNDDIDLVLLDIRLPELSGYDVVKLMKQLRPKIPVIAQTAYALHGDKELSINAGCDDYLAKPIKKMELLKTLAKYSIPKQVM